MSIIGTPRCPRPGRARALDPAAAAGGLKPAGVARSAAWVEAGRGVLELRFGPEVVEASGLQAPYEVRDLRLADQARMAVLHQQARALRSD